MKYLFISFNEAGFYEPDKKNQRNAQNASISVNQVSNMLHSIFGEIPVPTYRETKLKKVDWIFELANKTLISIETPMIYHDESLRSIYRGKNYYPFETQRLNKAAWNSYRDKGVSFVDWEILNVFLGDKLLSEFITTFSHVLNKNIRANMPANYAVNEAINYLKTYQTSITLKYNDENNIEVLRDGVNNLDDSNPINTLFKNLLKKGRTPFLRWLLGYSTDIAVTKGNNLKITVTNHCGLTKMLRRISGKMIVPMTDYALEKLQTGKGCATLLDDGYVHIDRIVDGSELPMTVLENFININKLEEHEQNLSMVHTK